MEEGERKEKEKSQQQCCNEQYQNLRGYRDKDYFQFLIVDLVQ